MFSHWLKLLLLAAVALTTPAAVRVDAFVVPAVVARPSQTNEKNVGIISVTRRSMSDNPRWHDEQQQQQPLGATERLLLERKYQQDAGLVQEYGRTIKKDGLDAVRAAVWALFHVSQTAFAVLAVAMTVTLALNMAGYGYYIDPVSGEFHLDTMQQIAQMRLLETETARLAAGAAETMMR